jgi:hypothetical protein
VDLRARWQRARSRLALPVVGRIAQSALAAGAAWEIALQIPGHGKPFFAPIAAVIALGAERGRRGRQAIEVMVGVTFGILFGAAIVAVAGVGACSRQRLYSSSRRLQRRRPLCEARPQRPRSSSSHCISRVRTSRCSGSSMRSSAAASRSCWHGCCSRSIRSISSAMRRDSCARVSQTRSKKSPPRLRRETADVPVPRFSA